VSQNFGRIGDFRPGDGRGKEKDPSCLGHEVNSLWRAGGRTCVATTSNRPKNIGGTVRRYCYRKFFNVATPGDDVYPDFQSHLYVAKMAADVTRNDDK
jgi:hypothetical protein